jgi:hypothetical protein
VIERESEVENREIRRERNLETSSEKRRGRERKRKHDEAAQRKIQCSSICQLFNNGRLILTG